MKKEELDGGLVDRPPVPDLGSVFSHEGVTDLDREFYRLGLKEPSPSASDQIIRFNDALRILEFYTGIDAPIDNHKHVIEAKRIITDYLKLDNNEENK